MNIEICVDSLESAIIAEKAGADRIELCADLCVGGTTPSYGLMKLAREYLNISIYAMIRPRSGDFCYSDYEFQTMKQDILSAKKLGLDGVVFGILKPDGEFDLEKMQELIECVKPLKVTVHRAFDMSKDLMKSLEQLKQLGVERILTSGSRNKAIENLELIKELIDKSKDEIIIMPGSGINKDNILEIIQYTGAKEVHFSGKRQFESKMKFRKQGITMGASSAESEYLIEKADYDKIKEIKDLILKK